MKPLQIFFLIFGSCGALSGCGSGGIPPYPDGSLPILASPEIATGAWTIEQVALPGQAHILPIGAFLGALTASGTHVQGAFTTASTDVYGSGQISRCVLNPLSPVIVSGTASNGTLTLQGAFESNTVRISGQLSADRRRLTSGTYSVEGPCATPSAPLIGHLNPPLNGTFVGSSVTASGKLVQITANLTQGDVYYAAGYIPISGSLEVAGATCTVAGPMLGAFIVGSLNELIAYSQPNVGDNIRFYGGEDDDSKVITIDAWGYDDAVCGYEYSSSYVSPTTLIKQ